MMLFVTRRLAAEEFSKRLMATEAGLRVLMMVKYAHAALVEPKVHYLMWEGDSRPVAQIPPPRANLASAASAVHSGSRVQD